MWQILILFYFIFGSASYLLRRVLAQKLGEHNRIINSVFFIFFLLPAIFILVPFFPHNLHIGTLNLFFLLGGSVIWPVCNVLSFQANKKVDVGVFAIISNLSPLFTILIAIPFLHENLSRGQVLGGILLVISGVLAAISQFKKSNKVPLNALSACLLAAVVLGVAIAYERFMLTRVDFGAYLVYGWGSQILWSIIIAHKEITKLPFLLKKDAESRNIILAWGATNLLKSLSFILALKTSTASIISVATDFLSVAVVVSAYFFLKERNQVAYKILASIIGIAGLLFIVH